MTEICNTDKRNAAKILHLRLFWCVNLFFKVKIRCCNGKFKIKVQFEYVESLSNIIDLQIFKQYAVP